MIKTAAALLALAFISCASGVKISGTAASTPAPPWHEPYVEGMYGAENIAFDGEGSMFVTGLDGRIFRVIPGDNDYRGKIAAEKKIGKLLIGIAVGPQKEIYVGVENDDETRNIYKTDRDFSSLKKLTGHIDGLNGFTLSSKGRLYFATSNTSLFLPKGGILYADIASEENFKKPVTLLDDAAMVNGLALSNDESILYFTETTGALKSFTLATGKTKKLYEPSGFFQIIDDLTVDSRGRVWICQNAEQALFLYEEGAAVRGFTAGKLKAPSSCAFGSGKGFRSDFLYVTEFGLKGRSLTMNGRGVWAVPVYELTSEGGPAGGK
jgi:streptogramin lyase